MKTPLKMSSSKKFASNNIVYSSYFKDQSSSKAQILQLM